MFYFSRGDPERGTREPEKQRGGARGRGKYFAAVGKDWQLRGQHPPIHDLQNR